MYTARSAIPTINAQDYVNEQKEVYVVLYKPSKKEKPHMLCALNERHLKTYEKQTPSACIRFICPELAAIVSEKPTLTQQLLAKITKRKVENKTLLLNTLDISHRPSLSLLSGDAFGYESRGKAGAVINQLRQTIHKEMKTPMKHVHEGLSITTLRALYPHYYE